jgi:hypothetical protein
LTRPRGRASGTPRGGQQSQASARRYRRSLAAPSWPPTGTRLPRAHAEPAPAAAIAARLLDRDWWVYNFSHWREDSGVESRGADGDRRRPELATRVFRRLRQQPHAVLKTAIGKWLDWSSDYRRR